MEALIPFVNTQTHVEQPRARYLAAISLMRHTAGCVPRITLTPHKHLRSISQIGYCYELSTYTRTVLVRNQTSSRRTETNYDTGLLSQII